MVPGQVQAPGSGSWQQLPSGAPPAPIPRPKPPRLVWPIPLLASISVGAVVFLAVGMVLGGQLGRLAQGGLEVVPLVALAMLAYLGKGRLWARVMTWIWLVWMLLGVLMITVLMTLQAQAGAAGETPPPRAETASIVGLAVVLLLLALAVSVGTLAPGVRSLVTRLFPLDPAQLTSRVALVSVTFFALAFLVPLVVLGEPPLLKLVAQLEAEETSQKQLLAQTFYPLMWLVPCALLAVGCGVTRTARQAAHRLGLTGTRAHHLAMGLLTGIFLVAVIHFISPPLDELWKQAGFPVTDEGAVEKLFSRFMTPLGVVALSVSAGVGEELAFRGVLQPRLGLWLTNLLFTSLHAWQYNLDGLVVIFAVGLVMALVRKQYNTVSAVLAHATYDFGLCVLILYGVK